MKLDFSKACLLIILSQLNPDSEKQILPLCNGQADVDCPKYDKEIQRVPTLTWKLCLYTAILFPDLINFIFCTFRSLSLFHRNIEKIVWTTLWLELLFQSLNVIGISLLAFVTFPSFSMAQTLIATNLCILIPCISLTISDMFKKKQESIFTYILTLISDLFALGLAISCLIIFCMKVMPTLENSWSLPLGVVLASCTWWKCLILKSEYVENENMLLKKFTDIIRTDSTDKKCFILQMLLSLWKLVTFTSIFLCILAWQEEFSHNEDPLQISYANKIIYSYTPQHPPSLKLNETVTDCLHGIKDFTKCYADDDDCSGFWLRECYSDKPTLQYVQCPGNLSYNNVFNCYGTPSGCCNENIDCENRKQYNCSNAFNDMDESGLTYFDFPDNHDNWILEVQQLHISTIYPLAILAIQIAATWLAFKSIGLGCKSKVQIFGIDLALGLPTVLSVALTTTLSILACNEMHEDLCTYKNILPEGISWNCDPTLNILKEYEYTIQILLLFAELWIGRHIWTVKTGLLENTSKLFHYSMYHSFLMEQSLLFQRRQTLSKTGCAKENTLVKIKACATMWHETKEEIKILLLSINDVTSHLDKQRKVPISWETHVFFDDAFDQNGVMNSFVKDLIQAMAEVFQGCHCVQDMHASYGGTLNWVVHNSRFVCHLKDKTKIRNKKRWSQCMYFSYFTKSFNSKNILSTKKIVDQHEFVLALDGDISFKYNAVEKLVDMALKSDDIGAVCGQIHPTGSGYMTLYQEFEYQTGHWLQKSTESILGNVLCSPGCFSLIRLKAMLFTPASYTNQKKITSYETELQKSALERYLTEPTEPKHYVQYDQGEDRWLCTLLIERGWKIQYSALSMCKTACPTTFDEFFNQRRRWSPSTVANLWDLLYNGGPTLLKNGYISIFHLGYQFLSLSSAAIGPGSIFLLLVGGTKLSLQTNYWAAMGTNIFLILLFLVVSLFTKRKYHILVAKSIGLVYGLQMVVILIAMMVEFKKELDACFLTPPILSLMLTAGSFLFVALLHLFQPPEFSARFFFQTKLLRFGLATMVFYISIPSMYLLLPMYCVFNIDDISWGTREKQSDLKVKEREESANSSWNKLFNAIKLRNIDKDHASVDQTDSANSRKDDNSPDKNIKVNDVQQINKSAHSINDEQFWDFVLQGKNSDRCNLPNYLSSALKPSEESEEQKKDKSKGLQAMRTEVFLVFIFLNASWCFGIFWMQQAFEDDGTFGLDWQLCPLYSPLDYNMTGNGTVAAILDNSAYYQLDPINVVFMVLFLILIIINTIGMLTHRLRTFGHWMASSSGFEKSTELRNNEKSESR